VPGVLLAGTYGVEFQVWDGSRVDQLEYARVRPVIENLKERWGKLLEGRDGFYLEDKGWALAIHARFAKAEEADLVMEQAESMARTPWPGEAFQLIIGARFLEIASSLVDKGQTIHYLIEKFPWPGAYYVYLGDDARDEKAFEQVIALGGVCVKVGEPDPGSHTPYRLASPAQARLWLQRLVQE
jgi:trehalose 6-phosphate phosphatase